jgi:hypothetical protein
MKQLIFIPTLLFSVISSAQTEQRDSLGLQEIDTIRFNMGKKKVLVVTTYEHPEPTENKEWHENDYAHWSGIGGSFNFFLNDNYAIADKEDALFLELDNSRSASLNMNLLEKRFPIYKKFVGLTTGLGFQFSYYDLKNNFDVNVTSDSTYGTLNTAVNYKINRLQFYYVQVPLLLEFNSSKDPRKNWHFSFGMTGAYRLASSFKTRYRQDGKSYNDKMRSHFNMNPFQAYATAIIGYSNYSLVMHYGLTPLFEKGKGPSFAPINMGVLVNF